MIPAKLLLWAIIAVVVVTASAYGLGRWQGWSTGKTHEATRNAEALRKTQERLFMTADSLSEASARLEAARTEREDLALRIEDEARGLWPLPGSF